MGCIYSNNAIHEAGTCQMRAPNDISTFEHDAVGWDNEGYCVVEDDPDPSYSCQYYESDDENEEDYFGEERKEMDDIKRIYDESVGSVYLPGQIDKAQVEAETAVQSIVDNELTEAPTRHINFPPDEGIQDQQMNDISDEEDDSSDINFDALADALGHNSEALQYLKELTSDGVDSDKLEFLIFTASSAAKEGGSNMAMDDDL